MALNLNTSPYYDDFDPANNYNRILFKPGVAVQARELTQLQTVLQDQIGQISSFTLKEGAVISGCEEFTSSVPFIKINDSADYTNNTLPNYIGETVQGGTTGLKAKILDVRGGTENDSNGDEKTLYLSYFDGGGTTNTSNAQHFDSGEILTVVSPGFWNGDTFEVADATDTLAKRYWGHAQRIQLSPGIIYAKGQFIRTEKIGCYVDRHNSVVRRQIGFVVDESIVGSDTDGTLLDPASGTYNYNSPGADRYKVAVTLRSIPLDSAPPDNFYRYCTYQYGKFITHKIKNDPLAQLGDEIAKRAHAANGNYVINGYYVTVQEHLKDSLNGGRFTSAEGGDNSLLIAAISPGRANIGGYLRSLENELPVPFKKPTTSVKATDTTLTTSYGNYIEIDEMAGVWDIGSLTNGDGVVDLYDGTIGAATYVLGTGNVNNVTNSNTKIGEAKVRQIVYSSGTIGTASAKYKLYLYDIKITSGDFTDVQGIHYENGTIDAYADVVAASASLEETDYNRMLWRLPKKSIKTLQDTSDNNSYQFEYLKEIDITSVTTATFDIDADGGNLENFPWANSAANLDSNLILVATAEFTANSVDYNIGQIIDAEALYSAGDTSVGGSVTIDLGGAPSATASFKAYAHTTVSNTGTTNDPISKTAQKQKNIRIDIDNHPNYTGGQYSLGLADVYKLRSVTAYTEDTLTGTWTGTTSSSTITGSGGAAQTELVVGALLKDSNGAIIGTVSTITDDDTVVLTGNASIAFSGDTITSGFSDGSKDVTSDFRLTNGQKDNYYGLAFITKKGSSTLDLSTYKYLNVEFDYFTRSSTFVSFTTVDSYPLPSSETATASSSQIYYQEIPIFVSQKYGVFDLRDCVDFRPYAATTATTNYVKGTSSNITSYNPSSIETLEWSDYTFPTIDGVFETDIYSYVPQAFRCAVDMNGEVSITEAPKGEKVSAPYSDSGKMTLATFVCPPFPCLTPKSAMYYDRADLALRVSNLENPHYTMRDIGKLERRITNIEYYTSLSMLEKEARDQQILDSSGVDRFKHGLLVDSFKGHSVAASGNPDFKAAIDGKRQHLRAYFNESTVDFRAIDTSGSGAGQSGSVFHVPFEQRVYVEQMQASKAVPVVIELLYDTTDPVAEAIDNALDTANLALRRAASAAQAAANAQNGVNTTLNTVAQNAANIAALIVGQDDLAAKLDNLPVPTSETIVVNNYIEIPVPAEPIQDTSATDTDNTTDTDVDDGPIDDPSPIYTLIRSKNRVDEGSSVIISVKAENHRAGNTVDYTVTGVTSADISGASLTGTLTFANAAPLGTANVTFNIAEDATTEGEETLTFTLGSTDGLGYSTGSKSTSVVINDTSITERTPCGPGYVWSETEQACIPGLQPTRVCAGVMSISPDEDVWMSYESHEIVLEDKTGEYSQFVYPEPWNVTWNGWEDSDPIITTTKTSYEDLVGSQVEKEYVVNERAATGTDYAEEGYYSWTVEKYAVFEETTTNTIETGYKIDPYYNGILPGPIIETSDETEVVRSLTSFMRAIAIDYSVEGLCENMTHNVVVGGINKGTVVTDSMGNASGTISVSDGELKVGTHEIIIAASGSGTSYKNIESYASAIFTSQHDVSTTTTTKQNIVAPRSTTTKLRSALIKKDPVVNTVVTRITPLGSEREDIIDHGYTQTSVAYFDSNTGIVDSIFTQDEGTVSEVESSTSTAVSSDEVALTNIVSGANPAHLVNTANNTFSNVYLTTTNTATQAKVSTSNNNFTDTSAGEAAPTNTTIDANIEITYDIDNADIEIAAREAAKAELIALRYMRDAYGMYCPSSDPMAQTFLVEGMPGGMYLSEVDLFFKRIATEASDNGITLEVREVINGMPGPTSLGRVHKRRTDCTPCPPSSSGAVTFKTTTFRFDTPIYLQNNTEYCLVPIPDRNDPNYEIWLAELGENEVGTSRVISKQAAAGILFTSANNRSWTPHQNQDLMFRLKRCFFRTGREFVVNMKNKNMDWIEFDESTSFDPGTFVHGFKFNITNDGAGYATSSTSIVVTVDNTNTGGTGLALTANTNGSGQVTGFTVTDYGSGYFKPPSITIADPSSGTDIATATVRLNRGRVARKITKYDTHEIEVIQGHFDDTHGSKMTDGTTDVTVGTIHDRIIDAFVLKSRVANYGSYGKLTPRMLLTRSSHTTRTDTPNFMGTGSGNTETFSDIVINKTTELLNPCKVYSYSNSFDSARGATASVQFGLKTEVDNLSPMVNAGSTSMLMITNKINNDASGEEVATGGTADSRYISKKVVLADGQDAEDLKVYLDNKKAQGDIKVYAKFQNKADDSGDFLEDIVWKELEVESSPFDTSAKGWAEYVYKIPARGSDNIGVNSSGVLEYVTKEISSISIDAAGTGYDTGDTIRITGGDGRGGRAIITSVGSSGEITGVSIENPGRYSGTPTLTVAPTISGNGAGATLTATMTSNLYTGFKSYSIKIVHISSNTSQVPKSANLRAYALAV